jgi:predicted NUDIX family phosphoesterase
MQTAQRPAQNITNTHDEMILVVKRADIFSSFPVWHGLAQEPLEHCLETIKTKKEFQPRSVMETDPTYKQIIPYLIFNHEDGYFLMQRQGNASEQRLKNKYSLGIGGHIRLEDMSSDSIFEWAKREFHEEVNYAGDLQIETVGILNDDTNAVGQVHIGLVLLLKGNNSHISVKSELKSGTLLTLQELQPFVEHMESWSQMVYEKLAL